MLVYSRRKKGAYIKGEGKVDTVKIVTLNGTDATAEYNDEKCDSAYDKKSKMFFVNRNKDTDVVIDEK